MEYRIQRKRDGNFYIEQRINNRWRQVGTQYWTGFTPLWFSNADDARQWIDNELGVKA